ncbi:hypothetical protein [Brevundimonas sp.]|jgi:hypothetical protein|uniref:hypothetical protein n=1 Tax=Brevundimonas sp. TaxID=1871086 RepID=UPI002E131020|nr:hypothetical protein [Brevundimonas sp.]
MTRPSPALIAAALLTSAVAASSARAQVLADAATHAPPQHYLITLPPTPVAEVAEVVLGQTLGIPYKIDADVKGEMTFKVDGPHTPQELAREFGYRLWNADVALIERPSDGLWLIPESELPAALAAGATVVSPLANMPARPMPAATGSTVAAVSKDEAPMGFDGSWLAWLAAGWAAGAASAFAWLKRRTAREERPVALLTWRSPRDPEVDLAVTPSAESPPDDDLVIPTFDKPAGSGPL